MDFDYSPYYSGPHARERVVERVPEANWDNADEVIINLAEEGTIMAEVKKEGKKYRYLRSGDFFLPCVADFGYIFKVMSVLPWDMIKRNENTSDFEALQYRLDRYHYS